MQNIITELQKRGFTHTPILDGQFHRFKEPFKGFMIGRSHATDSGENYSRLYIGCYNGSHEDFVLEDGKFKDKQKLARLDHKMRMLIQEQKRRDNLDARAEANKIWGSAKEISALNDYLKRKGFELSWCGGLRLDPEQPETLYVPMYDLDLNLWNIQKIFFSGEKQFLDGGRFSGLQFTFGEIDSSKTLYLCEGLATAMTVHAATNMPTVCAFNAGNLKEVAVELRARYPLIHLVIAGDNDHAKTPNTGLEKAIEAAQAAKAEYVVPSFEKADADLSDFNDLGQRAGRAQVSAELHRSLSQWDPEKIFAPAIEAGFQTTEVVNGKFVQAPDYVNLRQYFDLKFPYKSLRTNAFTYAWNGTHYIQITETEMKGFAHKFFKPEPNLKQMAEFVGHLRHTNLTNQEWFETTSRDLINFRNGVFNTITGEFEPGHSKDRGFKYCLPYSYDQGAACPMFDTMLEKITCGDLSLQMILLEFFGYALANGPCFADKVLVLHGEGANGKSRFLNVMKAVMGHATVGLSPRNFGKDSVMLRLEKSLMAVFEELPAFTAKDFWEEIKNLSAGGGITLDVKYDKHALDFSNRAKFVFTCNKLPAGTDPTHGFFRRLLLIPFNATFRETDADHKKDIDNVIIASELPGIFNRVYSAYRVFQERGYKFSESKAANDQIAEYMVESDSVRRWLEDAEFKVLPIASESHCVKIEDLYLEYMNNAKSVGERHVEQKEFAKRLYRIHPELKVEGRIVRVRDVTGRKPRTLVGVTWFKTQPF